MVGLDRERRRRRRQNLNYECKVDISRVIDFRSK